MYMMGHYELGKPRTPSKKARGYYCLKNHRLLPGLMQRRGKTAEKKRSRIKATEPGEPRHWVCGSVVEEI